MMLRPCLRAKDELLATVANGAAISRMSSLDSVISSISDGDSSSIKSPSANASHPFTNSRITTRAKKSCHSSSLGGPFLASPASLSRSGFATTAEVETGSAPKGVSPGYSIDANSACAAVISSSPVSETVFAGLLGVPRFGAVAFFARLVAGRTG